MVNDNMQPNKWQVHKATGSKLSPIWPFHFIRCTLLVVPKTICKVKIGKTGSICCVKLKKKGLLGGRKQKRECKQGALPLTPASHKLVVAHQMKSPQARSVHELFSSQLFKPLFSDHTFSFPIDLSAPLLLSFSFSLYPIPMSALFTIYFNIFDLSC